ncbi:hypothetical protein H0H92_000150 [Tricholoma furcatifolium]|nr:hypothetical protein H0H92_000150 [Tricholoma furcatifolium]
MPEFHSTGPSLPHIPDNLTIPQFFLDVNNPLRPVRPERAPWLIKDGSTRAFGHSELSQSTHGLANALSSKWNIGKGDTVCIFSPNNVAYPVCIWATHTLGGIITPANPAYKGDELVHQLRTSKASLLIIHPAFLSTAKAAAKEVGLSDDRIVFIEPPLRKPVSSHLTFDELVKYGLSIPKSYADIRFKSGEAKTTIAFLSFSSGTTGKPKAVAIPHYSVIANVIQMVVHNKLNDPGYKNQFITPGDVGIAALFHPKSFSSARYLELLFCSFSVIPTVSTQHPSIKNYDLSHVKYCMSGAAPLSGDLVKSLRQLLPNAVIGQGYGLTETCTTVTMLPTTHKIGTLGSAGLLLPGIVARVVKQDGSLAREGEQGELVVKGPSMALGYLNNEAATKETFVDGWVRTGDEVVIRKNDVFVVDRLKEILKVRGFQVAPAELEGHLLTHCDVADACVVSIPDDYSGELPFAYIVLSEVAARRTAGNARAAIETKAAIAKHVSDVKVPYKHLTGGIEFIDAVPKNPSGKIVLNTLNQLRRVLRDEARKLRRPKDENQAKL